jgi:menaquinone-specific isochorismate synthase
MERRPRPDPHAPDLAEAARRAVSAARSEGPAVLSWTAPGPTTDAMGFLAAGEPPRFLFAAPGGHVTAGLGVSVALEAAGRARFDDLRLQAERLRTRIVRAGAADAPPPRFLGGFAFADEGGGEPWEGFPSAWFVLPSVAMVHEGARAWVQVNRLVEGREDPEALARHVAAVGARAGEAYPDTPGSGGLPLPPFGAQVVERDAWVASVEGALRAIRRGPLRKVVLARRVALPLTGPLAGPAALRRLAAGYPDCYLYLAEPASGTHFLGATPELLVRRRGRAIATAAVAGSAPRGRDADEDDALGAALLASPKERAEHDAVARHIRERLAGLGAKLEGDPVAPSLLKLRNVQHLHTPFHAALGGALHALELAAALHPTPAVAGSPTREALAFIGQTEHFARGWYAGAVGWFDLEGDGELAVALRCALVEESEAWLFAGAGIVAGADPGREWEETLLKMQPMLEALGCKP